MSIEITVPSLGESVTEATIARWLKQIGEAVTADEPLVELETDKVTVEVPAPQAGVLSEVLVQEGDNVEVGALLGRIGEGGSAVAATTADKPAVSTSAPAAQPAASRDPLLGAGPAATKAATETGVTGTQIATPSGRDGRATKADVQNASVAPSPAATPQPVAMSVSTPVESAGNRSEERVRMSRLRKTIATRLKSAQSIAAILTTFNEVDMTAVMATRKEYQQNFEKRNGVRLGYMSFFIKASISALREIPAVNAEIDGDDIVYKNYYDIGVAVSTENGLVVPVIRNAEGMTFGEIEKTINDFGERARYGQLKMAELTGGTFTISNGGIYGSLMSTPILNPPQSAILGMHKIQQRPIVMPDGAIQARPMMYLALSYDHRIIDGVEAVTTLVRIKEGLEDPGWLMFNM